MVRNLRQAWIVFLYIFSDNFIKVNHYIKCFSFCILQRSYLAPITIGICCSSIGCLYSLIIISTQSNLQFSVPAFSALSQKMFDGVKYGCGTDVLAPITKCTNLHIEGCILLANTMLPELPDRLFLQHGEFCGIGTHKLEFPV